MRLRADAVERYERAHRDVWPEVLADLAGAGVTQISIYRLGLDLFVYSLVADDDAWPRHWASEVAARFGEATMGDVLDPSYGEAVRFLPEVFHATPGCPAS